MATKKPAKKTPAKKPVAKKKATSKPSAAAAAVAHSSFKLSPTSNFFTFKISRQTVYWTILIAVIIVFQLLILKAQYEVVDANNALLLQNEARANSNQYLKSE